MTLSRFIFKTHKWLAVGVGLFTFTWFVSGIVMVLPGNLFTGVRLPRSEAGALPFRDIAETIPQAIAAVDAAAGKPVAVTEISFRQLLGNLYYEIGTSKSGRHLVSTRDASRLDITEDIARQVATASFGTAASSAQLSLLDRFDSDYMVGPLPVYRLALEDGRGTIVYVSRETGELRYTNRLARLRGSLAGLHTFNFLRPSLSSRSTRIVLILFSAVGTLMSVFGFLILWLQLRNWVAARGGAAK